jgi:two-component system cell cycle response regulator DivK
VGQKILVVEDNELNLKLFCDLLRAHGYAAEPVRDGREAMERARAFEPDLVVMDIQMPHISGLELIEQMKADPDMRRTPIMAVTAYAAKGDEERIRDAGAEGYVSKPISVMKFVAAVRVLLEAAALREEEQAEPAPDPAEGPGVEAPGVQGPGVEVERSFRASPEDLFDAWVDPETAGAWLFATPAGEMVRVRIDAAPGGTYEIVERRDGEDVLHTGRYLAVERPERLEFTLSVPRYSDDEARIAVEIAGAEEGARLKLTQRPAPASPEDAEQYRQGWGAVLDGLARALDARQGPPAQADGPLEPRDG